MIGDVYCPDPPTMKTLAKYAIKGITTHQLDAKTFRLTGPHTNSLRPHNVSLLGGDPLAIRIADGEGVPSRNPEKTDQWMGQLNKKMAQAIVEKEYRIAAKEWSKEEA